MKKIAIIICIITMFTLAACGSSSGTTTNLKSLKEDEVIFTGTGKPYVSMGDRIINLEAGKASFEVKVNNSEKEITFSTTVLPVIEGSGSSTSITYVNEQGNFTEKRDFEVPEAGRYKVNISNLPDSFNGEWEIKIKQKQKKDEEYDQQLKLLKVQEIIGGRLDSSFNLMENSGIRNLNVLDSNHLSLLVAESGRIYKNELKNNEWVTVEEEVFDSSENKELRARHSDFEMISDLKTDKGNATIVFYDGKYQVFYKDIDVPQKQINISDEFLSMEGVSDSDTWYWDENKNLIYVVVNDKSQVHKPEILRFVLEDGKWVTNSNGDIEVTPFPFEYFQHPISFAVDNEGKVYVAANYYNPYERGNNLRLFLTAFDKNMNMIAKPTIIYNIFNFIDDTVVLKPTENGVEIWNVFDERPIDISDKSGFLTTFGVNKYSVLLE